ncbi:MAG: acyl-CoA dehydrogenase, partial [Bdellovibrio sp.]
MENLEPVYGILAANLWLSVLGSAVLTLFVGFFGSPLIVWAIATLAVMVGFGAGPVALGVVAALFAVFLLPPVRQLLVTSWVMKLMKPLMPKISATERTALDAGVVWVESDLFSGKPDFRKILQEPYPELTPEEKFFLEGPCEKLCAMIDAWKVWKTRELEVAIWDYMKKEKFLGMIIPKEYGGLAFSALAHSEVVMKVASRSISACITVMVPNSLGPAELLVHFGTAEQKKKYLPRLATGQDTPCFGLTEPGAGSDAGAITSSGELFRGEDGKLYIRLNWNKRWITLAAISTIIGLAFKLRDPKNLLGQGEDLGITVALIPSHLPGVVIGRRHDPLGVPFYNCPTQGKDVVVNAEDAVIGGMVNVGRGWQMLMECLAAG